MSAIPWELAPNLQRAQELGVLSMQEASEIEDAAMLLWDSETAVLPKHLHPAASRLWLWELEVSAPMQ